MGSFPSPNYGGFKMGRIFRTTIAENTTTEIDLSYPTPGKLFIRNAGSQGVRVGYDPLDVGVTGVNYFTIDAGVVYQLDMSPNVGYVSQKQLMYFHAVADTTMEFWFAN